MPLVAKDEAADIIVESPVLCHGGSGQLGEGVGTAVEGYRTLAVEAGALILLHVPAYAVLQRRHVGLVEYQPSVTVGPHPSVFHLGGYCRVLEFQLHSAHIGLLNRRYSLVERMPSFVLEVPVPVWLHPRLVYAQIFPVLVTGPQVIRYPVEALSFFMAIGGDGRGYYVPVLIAAVDVNVVWKVDFL